MAAPPIVGMNDVDAAGLGEWSLRGRPDGTWLYVSMGTGVGATAIAGGALIPVEFGHLTPFGPHRCGGCGRVGCLDAQIGGHALPTPLSDDDIGFVVDRLSAAVERQDLAIDGIVLGGGLPRRYPWIAAALHERGGPPVQLSRSPAGYKSAAPFGLLHAWQAL